MESGEIWSVTLPFAEGGREQSGQRPALVMQDSAAGQGSPLVLVVPLTSQISASRFPATVRLEPTPENGLTAVSIAMVFQIRALDRSRFVRRLGTVGDETVASLLAALDALLGR